MKITKLTSSEIENIISKKESFLRISKRDIMDDRFYIPLIEQIFYPLSTGVIDEDFVNLNKLIYKKILLQNCEIPLSRDFSEPFGTVVTV